MTKKPWTLSGKERDNVLYTLAESLRLISGLIYPVIPSKAEEIAKQIGLKKNSKIQIITYKNPVLKLVKVIIYSIKFNKKLLQRLIIANDNHIFIGPIFFD